jgi:hypothetical protein
MRSRKLTWAQKIVRARARNTFLVSEIDESTTWSTCAIGEVDPRFAKRTDWVPVELRTDGMYRMGLDFMHAVVANNFDGAAILLSQIETENYKRARRAHKSTR